MMFLGSKEVGSAGLPRRAFLQGSAMTLAGFGLTHLTGSRSEGSPSEEVRHLERFPGIEFRPIEIEGGPIEGSLETGPQGFWFHAKNGQVINHIVEDRHYSISEYWPNHVSARLFASSGQPVSPEMDSKTGGVINIMQTGDYFLVLSKKPDASNERNRFRVSVEEELEHGVKMIFRLSSAKDVRYPEDLPPIFPDGDFRVILDFNAPVIEANEGIVSSPVVEVYGQYGDVEQVRGSKVNLPENRPENRIRCVIAPYGNERVFILPSVPDQNGGRIWPLKSHIAVVVKDNPFYSWVGRFFTLGTPRVRQKGLGDLTKGV